MNGQWWITDDAHYHPAFVRISPVLDVNFQSRGVTHRSEGGYIPHAYRPVTASEAEAHLAARYTGKRAATVEVE